MGSQDRRNRRNRRKHVLPNLSGRQIGHYKLIRRISQSEFSDVYLGVHVILNMRVVVKVSKQERDEQHAFLTEARILAYMKHPHIINVIDYNHYKGRPYIVTGYAARGTLMQLFLDKMPVPVSTVLTYMQPVAEALDFLHVKGYVHHDVKASNIFLDAYDNVLLGDFGLAVPIGESSASGTFYATTTHAAPERIIDSYSASPSADVYAMGITLYHLLTGHFPFQGEDVLAQHVTNAPPPLRTYVPSLSLAVEMVVLKSLSKRVEDRFESVGELLNALRKAYEQSDDAGTMRSIGSIGSAGHPDNDESEQRGSPQSEDVLDTACALESYLLLSTLPAALAYVKGISTNICWLIFALSVLCIPTFGVLLHPKRRAKILVLLTLLASTLIGFVAQNLLLTGTIQFMALVCCTFFLFLYALFQTFR